MWEHRLRVRLCARDYSISDTFSGIPVFLRSRLLASESYMRRWLWLTLRSWLRSILLFMPGQYNQFCGKSGGFYALSSPFIVNLTAPRDLLHSDRFREACETAAMFRSGRIITPLFWNSDGFVNPGVGWAHRLLYFNYITYAGLLYGPYTVPSLPYQWMKGLGQHTVWSRDWLRYIARSVRKLGMLSSKVCTQLGLAARAFLGLSEEIEQCKKDPVCVMVNGLPYSFVPSTFGGSFDRQVSFQIKLLKMLGWLDIAHLWISSSGYGKAVRFG